MPFGPFGKVAGYHGVVVLAYLEMTSAVAFASLLRRSKVSVKVFGQIK